MPNFDVKIALNYLTAPASMNANPHCIKKMMMDMMNRKKWSMFSGFLPYFLYLVSVDFVLNKVLFPNGCIRFGVLMEKIRMNIAIKNILPSLF